MTRSGHLTSVGRHNGSQLTLLTISRAGASIIKVRTFGVRPHLMYQFLPGFLALVDACSVPVRRAVHEGNPAGGFEMIK